MFEFTFNYKGYSIVFAFENQEDLQIVKSLCEKLGDMNPTSDAASKQRPHIYFQLYYVGERLEANLDEKFQAQARARGSNCLVSQILYLIEDDRKANFQGLNHLNPWFYSCNNNTWTKSFTPDSIQKMVGQIDSMIEQLKTRSKTVTRETPTNSTSNGEQELSLDEFKLAYNRAYRTRLFKNPFSLMHRALKKNMITSLEQVEEYATNNPKTRTAKVLQSIRAH